MITSAWLDLQQIDDDDDDQDDYLRAEVVSKPRRFRSASAVRISCSNRRISSG